MPFKREDRVPWDCTDEAWRQSGFTVEEIRSAFYHAFHASGEAFFDYISSEQEQNDSTESYWIELEAELRRCRDRALRFLRKNGRA